MSLFVTRETKLSARWASAEARGIDLLGRHIASRSELAPTAAHKKNVIEPFGETCFLRSCKHSLQQNPTRAEWSICKGDEIKIGKNPKHRKVKLLGGQIL